jgi:hypothetical protein
MMSVGGWSVSLVALVGAAAALVAGSTVWLLLTDPVRGADVVSTATSGDLGPFMQAIGQVLYDALMGLFRFL